MKNLKEAVEQYLQINGSEDILVTREKALEFIITKYAKELKVMLHEMAGTADADAVSSGSSKFDLKPAVSNVKEGATGMPSFMITLYYHLATPHRIEITVADYSTHHHFTLSEVSGGRQERQLLEITAEDMDTLKERIIIAWASDRFQIQRPNPGRPTL